MKRDVRIRNYRHLAVQYAEAADVVDQHLRSNDPALAVAPVYSLLSHAAELNLKAYLLIAGRPEEEVRAKRHDLVKLFKACKEHAPSALSEHFTLDEDTLEALQAWSGHQTFRYWEAPSDARLPAIADLFSLVAQTKHLVELADAQFATETT